MQSIYKPIILVLFLMLSGCAIKHDYRWNEYQIAPERISSQDSFIEGQEIEIIEGKSDESKILLGNVGLHQYFGTEQSLTDGLVYQLERELKKKQIEIKNGAEKSLKITVERSGFERGMWNIAATINVTVEFGNGKTKSYSVRNSSPATVDRAFNGVVALAVIEIINDPEVRSYINDIN